MIAEWSYKGNMTLEHTGEEDYKMRPNGISTVTDFIKVVNCRIKNAAGSGIYVLEGARPDTKLCVLVESSRISAVVEGKGTSCILKTNIFRHNQIGVDFKKAAKGQMEDNICEQNTKGGICINDGVVHARFKGNRCRANEKFGVYI